MSKKTPAKKATKKTVKKVIRDVTAKSAEQVAKDRRAYRMKAHFPKVRKEARNLQTPEDK